MDQYFQLAHTYQVTGIFSDPLLDSSLYMANLFLFTGYSFSLTFVRHTQAMLLILMRTMFYGSMVGKTEAYLYN